MTQRIDYLAELGITRSWLMPSTRPPNATTATTSPTCSASTAVPATTATAELHPHGRPRCIRVIADLVVNHTSNQYPWFYAAAQQGQPLPRLRLALRPAAGHLRQGRLPDKEDSIWEPDEKTGEWYPHHFYKHQPDLNFANPKAQDEIAKSIGFVYGGHLRVPRRRRPLPHRRR